MFALTLWFEAFCDSWRRRQIAKRSDARLNAICQACNIATGLRYMAFRPLDYDEHPTVLAAEYQRIKASLSDNEAIQTAQQYRDGADMELWQLDRFVARIPKKDD